jgi:hypothetical protein
MRTSGEFIESLTTKNGRSLYAQDDGKWKKFTVKRDSLIDEGNVSIKVEEKHPK